MLVGKDIIGLIFTGSRVFINSYLLIFANVDKQGEEKERERERRGGVERKDR